jgi:hypothetical protein
MFRKGQVTEEELFSNITHSLQFEDFLAVLGQRVNLQGLQGFAGQVVEAFLI